MGNVTTNTQAKEIIIEAVITRADGTVEDLGMISYWHKNPFKRFMYRVHQFTGKYRR